MELLFLENLLVVSQMAVSSPITLVCFSLSSLMICFFNLQLTFWNNGFAFACLLYVVGSLLSHSQPTFLVVYYTRDVCVILCFASKFCIIVVDFFLFFLFTFYIVRLYSILSFFCCRHSYFVSYLIGSFVHCGMLHNG